MKRKSLARNAIMNGIKTVITTVVPVIIFMYASRVLYSEGIGKIGFSKAFVSYFVIVAMLGIVNYGTKEVAKVRDDKIALSRLSQELLIINLAATAFSFVFFLFVIRFGTLSQYKTLLLINGISVILAPLGMEWLYNALEEYEYVTKRTCIVYAIGAISVFVFVHDSDDIWKYALIQTLMLSGTNVINFIHSRKYILLKNVGGYNFRKHIRPIFTLFILVLLVQIVTNLDVTLLGFFSGDEVTGLYSAASKTSVFIGSIISAMVMVFMPRIALDANKGKREEVSTLASVAINFIILIGLPASVGVTLLSEPIMYLLCGNGFAGAILPSRILAWRILFSSINCFVIVYLFIPISKEKWAIFTTGIAALFNFIGNMLLIPAFNQTGAAIVNICTEIFETVIIIVLLRKNIRAKDILKNLLQCMTGCVYIVGVYCVSSALVKNMYLLLGITAIFGALGYFAILSFLKNEYFRKFLTVTFKKHF